MIGAIKIMIWNDGGVGSVRRIRKTIWYEYQNNKGSNLKWNINDPTHPACFACRPRLQFAAAAPPPACVRAGQPASAASILGCWSSRSPLGTPAGRPPKPHGRWRRRCAALCCCHGRGSPRRGLVWGGMEERKPVTDISKDVSVVFFYYYHKYCSLNFSTNL